MVSHGDFCLYSCILEAMMMSLGIHVLIFFMQQVLFFAPEKVSTVRIHYGRFVSPAEKIICVAMTGQDAWFLIPKNFEQQCSYMGILVSCSRRIQFGDYQSWKFLFLHQINFGSNNQSCELWSVQQRIFCAVMIQS